MSHDETHSTIFWLNILCLGILLLVANIILFFWLNILVIFFPIFCVWVELAESAESSVLAPGFRTDQCIRRAAAERLASGGNHVFPIEDTLKPPVHHITIVRRC